MSFALAADGLPAIVPSATERRNLMYSPVLNEDLVKTIYRLKRVWKKPMTEIADSLIKQSLRVVDKNAVCEVCIGEKNNQCDECCLNERRIE